MTDRTAIGADQSRESDCREVAPLDELLEYGLQGVVLSSFDTFQHYLVSELATTNLVQPSFTLRYLKALHWIS